jgi:hypothetical protein
LRPTRQRARKEGLRKIYKAPTSTHLLILCLFDGVFERVVVSLPVDKRRRSYTHANSANSSDKDGVEEPDPNSTTARSDPVKSAISLAACERIGRSVRVG